MIKKKVYVKHHKRKLGRYRYTHIKSHFRKEPKHFLLKAVKEKDLTGREIERIVPMEKWEEPKFDQKKGGVITTVKVFDPHAKPEKKERKRFQYTPIRKPTPLDKEELKKWVLKTPKFEEIRFKSLKEKAEAKEAEKERIKKLKEIDRKFGILPEKEQKLKEEREFAKQIKLQNKKNIESMENLRKIMKLPRHKIVISTKTGTREPTTKELARFLSEVKRPQKSVRFGKPIRLETNEIVAKPAEFDIEEVLRERRRR